MQGHLIFSFVGQLGSMDDGGTTLAIHPVVSYDDRLDTTEIAIHTRWIIFDEPIRCAIGLWPGQDGQGPPVFEVTRTLEPDPTAGTLARLCTVSVRLRRELLTVGSLVWIKVFGNDTLATQYPLKISAAPGVGGDQEDPAVH